MVHPIFFYVVHHDCFLDHAGLLHHPTGGGIAFEVSGEDFVKPQFFEAVINDDFGGLGCIALSKKEPQANSPGWPGRDEIGRSSQFRR